MTSIEQQAPVIDLRSGSDTEDHLGSLSIAAVHEWFTKRAGSEILFEQMAKALPNAELFALTANDPAQFDFDGRTLTTTALQRLGPLSERRGLTLPTMPSAWNAMDPSPFDVIVSSTHAFGREFARGHTGIHCNYVHAPMRYAWTPELDGRGDRAGPLGALARHHLRRIDLRSVEWVDSFAANSRAVANRINDFYGRDATVIHPPVDVDGFMRAERNPQGYLLAASRWIPYKRMDLCIEAAARLGLPLVIAGSGPEEKNLRHLAAKAHPGGVTFVIQPPDEMLKRLLSGAEAFLFPAHEDFGIVAVEAQAAGCPVVGLAAGGSLDTVVDGETGRLSPTQEVDDYASAVSECLTTQPLQEDCRRHAQSFGRPRFRREIREWVEETYFNAV